jgi:hypothetical protein
MISRAYPNGPQWLAQAIARLIGYDGGVDIFISILVACLIVVPIVVCISVITREKPIECPECSAKAMKWVGSVRAHRRKAYYARFYLCECCGARFKDHLGKYSAPSDDEWKMVTD